MSPAVNLQYCYRHSTTGRFFFQWKGLKMKTVEFKIREITMILSNFNRANKSWPWYQRAFLPVKSLNVRRIHLAIVSSTVFESWIVVAMTLNAFVLENGLDPIYGMNISCFSSFRGKWLSDYIFLLIKMKHQGP